MTDDARVLAQRAVALLTLCPYCRGQQHVPYNGNWGDADAKMVDCEQCRGTGNLLGAMLADAYSKGRRDALGQAVAMLGQTTQALAQPAPAHVSIRSLLKDITGD